MSEWLVRPAAVADAVGIARVSVAAWRKAYAGIMKDPTLAALSVEARAKQWRERLADPANPATSLVAEQIGAIAGFVSIGPSRDADLDAVRVGELWAIYVDPMVWGKGAGTALFGRAVDALRTRGFDAFVLWVLAENQRARRFYEKHGMILDGGEKAPVEDGAPLPHVRYRLELRAG
jgi:ribosomal protein S18 acetylase RimI-like enzyme